ncbi:MAG TPA: hypothetical protein VJZ69_01540 [Clostridia bacterium]|nr:hypothetical protein [Clostridia bacterium]
MKKLRGRQIFLSVALVLLLLSIFSACNGATIKAGTIIEKTAGEPILFSFGQIKMIDPSRPTLSFVFIVQNEGVTASVYVTEEEYYRYSVGDWYCAI